MSSSDAKRSSLLISIPASTHPLTRSPTGSGAGSPYASTRSVSSLRSAHKILDPQNAIVVSRLPSANRTMLFAMAGGSVTLSNTVPSASVVSSPWMNTPGIGIGIFGATAFACHGPRVFPVASTVGTPHAAARAMATSVRIRAVDVGDDEVDRPRPLRGRSRDDVRLVRGIREGDGLRGSDGSAGLAAASTRRGGGGFASRARARARVLDLALRAGASRAGGRGRRRLRALRAAARDDDARRRRRRRRRRASAAPSGEIIALFLRRASAAAVERGRRRDAQGRDGRRERARRHSDSL
eukprot:7281-Pelagococcus_subviridis.AAC.2